jgi:hypothetical protein
MAYTLRFAGHLPEHNLAASAGPESDSVQQVALLTARNLDAFGAGT